jgi:hypothetical protein
MPDHVGDRGAAHLDLGASRSPAYQADPGGGRQLGRAVDHPVQRGVRSAPLTVEGGLPSWVRSVRGSLGRFVRGRLVWRPLVVERLHEVLVTARADRGAPELGDQAHGGCRPGGKLGVVTSPALTGGLGAVPRRVCVG